MKTENGCSGLRLLVRLTFAVGLLASAMAKRPGRRCSADAGADDMSTEDESYEITTAPENFEAVRKAIEANKIAMEEAEIERIPEMTVKVEGKEAEQVMKLIEAIEDHDDVQHLYANFDIDEKIMAGFSAE